MVNNLLQPVLAGSIILTTGSSLALPAPHANNIQIQAQGIGAITRVHPQSNSQFLITLKARQESAATASHATARGGASLHLSTGLQGTVTQQFAQSSHLQGVATPGAQPQQQTRGINAATGWPAATHHQNSPQH